MENQSGIYEIVNTVNGKRYIGSAVDLRARWWKHCKQLKKGDHHSPKLQAAWNKHGRAAFKFLPILTCQKSMLLFYEQQLLDKVKPEYNIALNATAPMLGRKASDETRKKMSEAQKARVRDPGTGAKISAALKGNTNAKGRVPTEAHRAALSKANMGNPGTPGNKNGLGYRHTQEAREAIRAASTGRVMSKEVRAKIAAAQKGNTHGAGRKLTQEHIDKLTAARQPYYEAKRALRRKKDQA
ncbi:MAG: NUMOD3 domain-containing DNA-binding protein [Gallionella sp.]|nr:NUMOD3 domain-containing DNA-binding protein [Gallionella sp.]